MNLNKKCKTIISVTTAAFFLLLSVIVSNYHIKINTYNYADDAESACRIVLISDLHGRKFGKNNSFLINKISEIKPDIICLAGDFIDEDNSTTDNDEFVDLLSNLTELTQVYYSFGNHDLYYIENDNTELIERMKNTGCIILNENYVDIDLNSNAIRLGGMFDYAFNQQYIPLSEWHDDSTYKFLTDFTDTERTKILMCHRPESFIYDDASLWNIDYVLSGHTHGGLWQLPFIGGLIAPEQGFFPEYDKGEFNLNNIKMIISSGFSGYKYIFRLFNTPEITVIELSV